MAMILRWRDFVFPDRVQKLLEELGGLGRSFLLFHMLSRVCNGSPQHITQTSHLHNNNAEDLLYHVKIISSQYYNPF